MRHLHLSALLLSLTTLACPATPGPGPDPVPQPTSDPTTTPPPDPNGQATALAPFKPVDDAALTALGQSNARFTADLYAQLAKSQGGNFAASPASISMALAMTYAGARGDTAVQMQKTLHLGADADATHRAFGTQLRSFAKKGAQYELTVANRLFGSDAVTFSDGYVAVTKDHYLAPLEKLDFRGKTEPSREHINQWVSTKTKDKIKDLLPAGSIEADTKLVLTNAIYFNGTWSEKFDKEVTREVAFTTPNGEVKAPTMHLEHFMSYGEADGNKFVSLFYRGGAIAMTIVLPDAKDGLAETEKQVAAGKLDDWVKGMSRAKVSLALPKFEIAGSALSLATTLKAMGMTDAFDEQRANFTGMAGGAPNLFIGDVFHKAFVDVHEEGTEAAAATGVVMYPTSAPLPTEPRPFEVDHPFLFFIRDYKSGSVLFMGRVTDPTQ